MDNRLNEDERDTVVAVLRTQAEMQAQEVLRSTETMSGIKLRNGPDAGELIAQMELNNDVLDEDCVGLNRLADKIAQGAD